MYETLSSYSHTGDTLYNVDDEYMHNTRHIIVMLKNIEEYLLFVSNHIVTAYVFQVMTQLIEEVVCMFVAQIKPMWHLHHILKPDTETKNIQQKWLR